MFTPKVTDQFMGVVNHRSCSKASDPLEVDLFCRVDGGRNTRPQNAVAISSTGSIQSLIRWLDTTLRFENLDISRIGRMLNDPCNACISIIIII